MHAKHVPGIAWRLSWVIAVISRSGSPARTTWYPARSRPASRSCQRTRGRPLGAVAGLDIEGYRAPVAGHVTAPVTAQVTAPVAAQVTARVSGPAAPDVLTTSA